MGLFTAIIVRRWRMPKVRASERVTDPKLVMVGWVGVLSFVLLCFVLGMLA